MNNETCIINAIIPRLKYTVMVIYCQSILNEIMIQKYAQQHIMLLYINFSDFFTRENMVTLYFCDFRSLWILTQRGQEQRKQ